MVKDINFKYSWVNIDVELIYVDSYEKKRKNGFVVDEKFLSFFGGGKTNKFL